MIPFLVVLLKVMRSEDKPHHRLSAHEATKAVFASMWTPVIMLLLGGFTIAAALSKYHIAKLMATFVLSKAGNKPKIVLITNMFVAMILSMWISNVAAPVLCFSIIQVRDTLHKYTILIYRSLFYEICQQTPPLPSLLYSGLLWHPISVALRPLLVC